jgi:hypothetical protein
MPVDSSDNPARLSRSDVLGRLKIAVERELAELDQAYKERPLSAVAWIARNLLELVVWVKYCSASDENANTFADDCARDAVQAIDLPDGFSNDETFSHRDARASIIKKAKEAGFETVDEGYTRVANAAKAVGLDEMFKHSNKLYSKFAHPTALMVMTPMEEFEQGFKNIFLDGGRAAGVQALRLIAEFDGDIRKVQTDDI